jgi:hypothetical protein
MKNVKFGFGQIANQTPTAINRTKRALNFISAGIVLYLPQLAQYFHTTTDNLTTVMGLSILGINVVGIMFGVEPDQKLPYNENPQSN